MHELQETANIAARNAAEPAFTFSHDNKLYIGKAKKSGLIHTKMICSHALSIVRVIDSMPERKFVFKVTGHSGVNLEIELSLAQFLSAQKFADALGNKGPILCFWTKQEFKTFTFTQHESLQFPNDA